MDLALTRSPALLLRAAGAAALLAGAAACSRDGQAAPGGPGGGPGGPGGRNAMVTLAPTDVASPTRAAMEDAIPVTGTLAPLDRAELRARLEGDLTGVYVREGQPVSAGQLLARFEAVEETGANRSAQADVAAARSELSTAQWNLDQTRELHREGAVPERDVRNADQAVAAARARVAAAESRQRTTSSSVSDTRVVAPTSGIIERRLVNPGEHVNRGASMFTLVRGTVLELAANVPERQALNVRPGQEVRFAAGGREFTGRVARVNPSVDPASRAVRVYVEVPNHDGSLRAGTFATGRIVSRIVEGALVVPITALRDPREGGKPFVYRIAGEELEMAEVSTGLRDEAQGLVEIVDGVSETDRIVVGNVGLLGRGMKVRIADPSQRGRGGPGGGAGGAGGRAGAGGGDRPKS
ncbi:MAG TPA: efflux RND transporter periplasmic adaptor subunit [Longimicrobium sp.]|nr:efflux RND transporter periplasmic adaptor subunit [Longimicrobium sp.]